MRRHFQMKNNKITDEQQQQQLQLQQQKEQSTYTQYFSVQFSRLHIHLITVLSLLHCNVWLTSPVAEHQMRKKFEPIIPCKLVPVLAMGCLSWGVHLSSGQPELTQFWSWPWDASTGQYIWAGYISMLHLNANVKLTLHSTALGHWMCLHRGTSAKRTSENLNTLRVWVLLHRGLFYKRPIKYDSTFSIIYY